MGQDLDSKVSAWRPVAAAVLTFTVTAVGLAWQVQASKDDIDDIKKEEIAPIKAEQKVLNDALAEQRTTSARIEQKVDDIRYYLRNREVPHGRRPRHPCPYPLR